MIRAAGPWGTGPYKLVEGSSTPEHRSPRVVLEANTKYWDKARFPRLKRIVFDNTLDQKTALELVKTGEGKVDLVTELSPLETLRVAQSASARLVKKRETHATVFGEFNLRKTGSPWKDVRLRQAVNFAVNRTDLLEYAAKGNGVILSALVPVNSFGHNPALSPYPFDPARARQLLQDAGYPDGLPLTLIAPDDLGVQATVIGKMLEQVGFRVETRTLDAVAFNRKTLLSLLDEPAEQQAWDIALMSWIPAVYFPVFEPYHVFALDGWYDWIGEQPTLRQWSEQILRAVDPDAQQALIRQVEAVFHDQAYFLFLYNPIKLYAVNKAVELVPYANTMLTLAETSVTDQHWSVRKRALKK